MTPYVVRTGDHLWLIAAKIGVAPDAIWNHPKNAELKKLRGNPNILCFGDILYLPAPEPKTWLPVKVGTKNRFAATVPTVSLSLTFSQRGKALAGAKCVVHGLAPPLELTTDRDGKLALTVPITTQNLTLEFPEVPLVRWVRVGHLDPVTEPSGVLQRLRNLGHIASRTNVSPSDEAAMGRLLTVFQKAHGLTVSGVLDADTQQALEKAHGC